MKYLVLAVVLVACGTKVPVSERDTTIRTPEKFEYELFEPTCSTGPVVYRSEKEYCEGLKIDSANRSCAKYQREALFEKYCLNKGYSWPKAYSCRIELYDYRANNPDPQYLLSKRNYCLPPQYGIHTSYGKLFYTEPKGRKIGINVVMDITGQRKDRGDGTAYVTTFNLNKPDDLDFEKVTSFHREGAVWDRLGDYWLYVACGKADNCVSNKAN